MVLNPIRRQALLGMTLLSVAVAVMSAACLKPTTPVRYDKPLDIGVAYVVDPAQRGQALGDVPASFSERVKAEISKRNLTPSAVPFDTLSPQLARVRDSGRRMRLVADASPDSDVLVLVETRAAFFSFQYGTFRWTVYAKITVGQADKLDQALVRELELPASLYYAHEGAPQALATAAESVARETGQLIDDYLAGTPQGPARPRTTPKAPPSNQPPIGPPPTGELTPRADDSIYFIMVDRFDNGDPSNDGDDAAPEDPAGWHGGDLQGVTRRLDYLNDLGVRTLWLSPVFTTRRKDFMGHGAFHGYWVEDIQRVDDHFGGDAALKELVAQAHDRDMRVLLDLVVNHVGYEAARLESDPDWFHEPNTIEDWNDPVQLVERQVHGLPDLAQEREPVFAHLAQAGQHWLSQYDVDGYRLDAVKHVPLSFWGRYNKALAQTHPEITLLGEMYDGSVSTVDKVQREGAFTHMFDFPLAFALRDVFCEGKPAARIAAVLSNDRLYTDPLSLVTFLDNHDLPRLRSLCGGDLKRVQSALVAQMAMRGTPALNYGTEAGLEGREEPANRADMQFDPPQMVGLKAHVKALLALRRQHPVLVKGATALLSLEDDLMVMARALDDQAALLLIHTGETEKRVSLPASLKDARVFDALQGTAVEDKTQVTLSPGESRLMMISGQEAAEGLMADQGKPSEVTVNVKGVSLAQGETLKLVGSAPELGAWKPEGGLTLSSDGQGGATGRFTVPAGVAMAAKLVIQNVEGQTQWEPGQDRTLFVGPDQWSVTVQMTLRKE